MTGNGFQLDDAPELTARFAAVLADEPPFELPLGDALDAAVHGGRRRRVRAAAARTVTMAACAVVVVGGFSLLNGHPVTVDRTSIAPGSQGGTVTTDPVPQTRLSPDQLEQLATAIATVDGGTVNVKVHRSMAIAEVSTPAGSYDVTVTVGRNDISPRDLIDGCSPADVDSKPCTVELRGVHDAAVSVAFSDGSGRASLTYVADAADGQTVWVGVDNYTEQPSGQKLVGPTWKQVGLTPAHIREALASSALG